MEYLRLLQLKKCPTNWLTSWINIKLRKPLLAFWSKVWIPGRLNWWKSSVMSLRLYSKCLNTGKSIVETWELYARGIKPHPRKAPWVNLSHKLCFPRWPLAPKTNQRKCSPPPNQPSTFTVRNGERSRQFYKVLLLIVRIILLTGFWPLKPWRHPFSCRRRRRIKKRRGSKTLRLIRYKLLWRCSTFRSRVNWP